MNTTPRISYSWLNSFTDDEAGGSVLNILTGLTGNAGLPNPDPPLADVRTLLTGFQGAQALAANGGKTETAAKNTAREQLVESVRQLGGYITRTAGGNLELLLSTNYPLQRDRVPLDIQPAPENLRLKHGKNSGGIIAACDVSLHRLLYEWQSAIGLNPTEWKSEPPTSSARTTLSGYTPGTWLNARVRSRVPAGASDWSSVIQIMVV